MKNKKEKVHIPNVGILIILFAAGGAANWYNVLAPLHEMWHVLFGIMEGATSGWSTTYSDEPLNSVSIYSGYFGEMIAYFAIMSYSIVKLRFKMATFFLGAAHLTLPYGWVGTDFYSVPHPGMIFAVWCITWVAVMWVEYIYIIQRINSLTKRK